MQITDKPHRHTLTPNQTTVNREVFFTQQEKQTSSGLKLTQQTTAPFGKALEEDL